MWDIEISAFCIIILCLARQYLDVYTNFNVLVSQLACILFVRTFNQSFV